MKNNLFGLTRKEHAFTIVELMIVVVIIGVLTTIMVIYLDRAKMRQRDARRISEVSSIAMALQTYKERTGSFPAANLVNSVNITYSPTITARWEMGNTPANGTAFLDDLVTGGDMQAVPEESKTENYKDKDYTTLKEATLAGAYRYLDFSTFSFAGCGGKKWAVIYTSLEIQRKVETEEQRPACLREPDGSNNYVKLYEGVAPNRIFTKTTGSGGSGGGTTTTNTGLGFGYARYLPIDY